MTTQALTAFSTSAFRLYDSQELLNMESNVASGYIVLMGGNEAEVPKMERSAINLAFLALTEGNVVDACFGAKTHVSAAEAVRTDRALRLATDAKKILNDAVHSSDAVREIAVKAYGQAFHLVLQYNEDVKRLNFITRCFRWKRIHRNAEASLVDAFQPLNEAIEAAS